MWVPMLVTGCELCLLLIGLAFSQRLLSCLLEEEIRRF